MNRRIRLLPVLIFAAALTLTLRVGELYQGAGLALVSTRAALAEDDTKAQAAAAATEAPAEAKPGEAASNESEAGSAASAGTEPGAPAGQEKGVGDEFDPRSVTEAEFEVLQRLAKRRNELDAQRRSLDLRENLLEATEKRLDAKLVELNKLKQTIEELLRKHDKEQEAKLESLVSIYEKMKPKKAAAIFEQLDMEILLDVVERMREARTAPILAAMEPARAKEVTAKLAERRQLPETAGTTGGG